MIEELAQEEFEVYLAKNELKLRQLLKKYSDSIVFANISEGMKESGWEAWIKSVTENIAAVDVGVIAAAENPTLKLKYLKQLNVRCGFTVMKPDISAVIKQLEEILASANAKGRRKYVRALTGDETNITVNLPANGGFVNGAIKDISSVGFSCSFSEDPNLTKNSSITDMQIRLKTQLVKAQGLVFGSRMEGLEKIYVVLLSPHTSPDVHTKIRKFIHAHLQSKMDSELKL